MNSLRQKILLGYAGIAALVVGLSLFSLFELHLLEREIIEGERIGKFFDISLEIRRFEKNYFLYRQSADLAETRAYVEQGRQLLREQAGLFAVVGGDARATQLAGALERYAGLMDRYGSSAGNGTLESDIRKSGKEIVGIAEELAKTERQLLQAMLDHHRMMLLGSVSLVGLLVVVIGHLLARRVVRPLKELERSMEEVAANRLTTLAMTGDDREIVSLCQAFNHVLRELELRQGQLVHSEKLAALGTLLSGVAHELNNPLSNIATSTQILAEEVGGSDTAFQQELVAQIDEETWRARRIVRSLLDYARDRDFRREDLPLTPLVEETLRLLKGQIPSRVAVTVRIPADLAVSADRQRLQQVLLNLVRNAVDAVEGAGEVSISAQASPAACATQPPGRLVFGHCATPGAAVEIEIRDNGHGIAPEHLAKIFDPFFTTKEIGKGLGLGLFIVFEIIEEHGGCIAVDSVPGRGTSFVVRLPQGEKNG